MLYGIDVSFLFFSKNHPFSPACHIDIRCFTSVFAIESMYPPPPPPPPPSPLTPTSFGVQVKRNFKDKI